MHKGGSEDRAPREMRGLWARGPIRAACAAERMFVMPARRTAAAAASKKGEMKDEYANVDDAGQTFLLPKFTLESGKTLKEVAVRYQAFGKLNERRTNAVVVCHALTGNAAALGWWPGMVGPGCAIDTDKYFVVCANVLGSCYGTCGPTSINPDTGRRYGGDFPYVTIRDTVRLHALLLKEELGVKEVFTAIGGSMGGMQALEWAMQDVVPLRSGVILAAGGRHNPWQIGVSELQRQAIYADPAYRGGNYTADAPPKAGISVARQIAMVSYRTHPVYCQKFGRDFTDPTLEGGNPSGEHTYKVEEYLRYQGQKFIDRKFDAQSYIALTRLMDSHDISRGRGDYHAVLGAIKTPFLVVGISSDILYPVSEQEELAAYLGKAELHLIDSPEGHDGFLLEQARIAPLVNKFLSRMELAHKADMLQEELSALKARL